MRGWLSFVFCLHTHQSSSSTYFPASFFLAISPPAKKAKGRGLFIAMLVDDISSYAYGMFNGCCF
jgi:hypothetical protein